MANGTIASKHPNVFLLHLSTVRPGEGAAACWSAATAIRRRQVRVGQDEPELTVPRGWAHRPTKLAPPGPDPGHQVRAGGGWAAVAGGAEQDTAPLSAGFVPCSSLVVHVGCKGRQRENQHISSPTAPARSSKSAAARMRRRRRRRQEGRKERRRRERAASGCWPQPRGWPVVRRRRGTSAYK